MKIPIEDKEETKLQMAPMIDMVFLLIIFFMCASHLSSSQSLTINIPTAAHGVVPKERPDRWVVNVMEDGTVFSGTAPVSIEDLGKLVAARVKQDPRTTVYLRADARTPHKQVRKVMGAMAQAGVDDFVFGVYSAARETEGAKP
jgi:biopolymer transport protein ExbD